ncbi:nitroreductase family protein [Convivina praedatoris]|uniref:Nitroreductase domain-containing protein n=1 Tax=Convivina praedatoris TaxID=2880963 RepID=A0ABN8H890_9LACO|nr:nitroreductase family protein [Convivina sp. LMG 32447]CAH1851852.1 hypothetical protein LMG032447_00423 [Convivina sp. LMG 32447]CAH1851885.1 hypothetical protein R078138_00433 [Convivina sp. LMG 32447]CAH1853005.1 hypothetical protein R077815_00684 [Convivina sp. LMG 32447]
MSFDTLQKQRRSIYSLGKNVSQTPEEIFNIVKGAVRETPTAFNSQSVRAIVLTGAAHDRLWDIVLAKLKAVSKSAESFEKTTDKINQSFKAGFGTVLLFTDTPVVKGLEENFPLYADNFYDWSEQGLGIADYAIWVALAEAGIGASTQHYNPLIDEDVQNEFNIPSTWRLRAEMPFGSIEAPAGQKDYMPDEDRFQLITSTK